MSTDLKYPVAYLENHDFDSAGNLVGIEFKGKPVMVLLQSSTCGHCTNAKPAFQEFANNVFGNIIAATIQSDGERSSEVELDKRMRNDIYPGHFVGYPSYMLITADGRRLAYNGSRDARSLESFVMDNN